MLAISFTTRWRHCSTLQQLQQLPEASSLCCLNMTGQTIAGINQNSSGPSLLGVDGLASRPLGGTGFFTEETVSILTSTRQLAQSLLGHTVALKLKENSSNAESKASSSCDEDGGNGPRRKREFIDKDKKDESYWDKRRKNNEAAKRSREKRRANDKVLEQRVLGLLEENARLRAELLALKFRFGLVKDTSEVSIISPSAHLCGHPNPCATHFYPSHTGTHHVSPHASPHSPVYGARAGGPLSEESGIPAMCSPSVSGPLCKHNGLSPRHPEQQHQEYNPHMCPLEVNEGQYANRQDSPEGLKSLPHKLRFKGPGGCSDAGDVSPTSHSRLGAPVLGTAGPNIQVRSHQQQVVWDTQTESQPPWSHKEACGGLGQQYQSPPCGYSSSSPLQNPRDTSGLTEDINLRSQISCLSQEVAQLKRLLSQQLLSKTS